MRRGQKTGAEQVVLKLRQIEVQAVQGRKFLGRYGWERPLGFDNGSLNVGTRNAHFITVVGAGIEDIEKGARYMALHAA